MTEQNRPTESRPSEGKPVSGSGDQMAVLPLRDIVVFPHMIVPLFVGREKSVRALEAVMKEDKEGVDVEGVRAVEVDVVVLGRREVSGELVGEREALGAHRVESVGEVGGSPQHGGVGDKGQAERLVDLVVQVAAADVALVGEEQVAAQGVQALALIESRRRACRLSPLLS